MLKMKSNPKAGGLGGEGAAAAGDGDGNAELTKKLGLEMDGSGLILQNTEPTTKIQ